MSYNMKSCSLYSENELTINQLFVANTAWLRFRGLLFRQPLIDGQGLLISPCNSVHTIGMTYAIDVVYLSKSKQVLKLVSGLKPYRSSICLKAAYVVELKSGSLNNIKIKKGDMLSW